MSGTGTSVLVLVAAGVLGSCTSTPGATDGRQPSASPHPPSATRMATTRPTSTAPASSPVTHVAVRVLPWRLPEPVGREAAMPTSGGVVVAGGLVAGDQSAATTYRLDLGTGSASRLADLPVPVHDVGGAVVDDTPEVIGGGNATEQPVVQSRAPNGGWRVTGQLPSPRSDLAAVAVGGRVFVVGGYDGSSVALADVLVSTDGGVFRVFGQLPVAVRYAAVASADGALWVLGGERAGVEVDAVQRIDLGTGHAEVTGRLPHPLGHASAVTWDGRVLLLGGRTSGSRPTAAMWWFDPASPRPFHRAGALPTPLADSAVVPTRRAVYLIGGETPELSDAVLRLTLRPPRSEPR